MAAGAMSAMEGDEANPASEPTGKGVLLVLALATAFVILTRWPVIRPGPFESDEIGFVALIEAHWFPIHHTLYLTTSRLIGEAMGDPYRGLVVANMAVSVLALTAAWWWLRALVPPATAAAAALLLGAAPVFWGYGGMGGNYPAAIAVGSFLLGIAYRTWRDPRPWHPFAAAAALALGTGYRQDIGVFWLGVFAVILWRHRWARAAGAGILFAAICLAWFGPVLHEAGGWAGYRDASVKFGRSAGYLNSVWSLGMIDAPLRYGVKLALALAWTLGPALFFIPRGVARIGSLPDARPLGALLVLSLLPPLGFHLLIHFGSLGYAFHEVPALLALAALGIGAAANAGGVPLPAWRRAPARLAAIAALLAAVFWFYPTNYNAPGLRGDFDLSFARLTRKGLATPMPGRSPAIWRTANSCPMTEASLPAGDGGASATFRAN